MTFETIIEETGKRIASLAGAMLTRDLTARLVAEGDPSLGSAVTKHRARRRKKAGTENTWVADTRARRVPTWVIQMTSGLDTKKKIVARFGPDARFENGKPLPPLVRAAAPRKAVKHTQAPTPITTQRAAAA
jgi:hypothetical protein